MRALATRLVLACALLSGCATPRVAAYVDGQPVPLEELAHRAARYHEGTDARFPLGADARRLREVLSHIIDDRLEAREAARLRVAVTSAEVDRALESVARAHRISRPELLAEAKRQGLSEGEYREELARQVLDGKLVAPLANGLVVDEVDRQLAYREYVRERVADHRVVVQMVSLQVKSPGGEAEMRLADDIVQRVRAGGDFCAEVQAHGTALERSPEREGCGTLEPQPVERFLPPIVTALRAMQPGDVSLPVRAAPDAIVALRLVGPAPIPRYDAVRDEIAEKAWATKLERARRAWLDGLRAHARIDIRL
jgi:peptidyl-prolyl cis-trans isomerase SurA